MSHSVLARKWRPRRFEEMVGQAPVVRALSNALTQNRLHHAYLFTGTRGVGKTSLARLFAKCLNCEQGVTATPCDSCSNCQMINQNRFLDLLEIDAASRTKVEDTRDLLENVQYAPTQGRYKIYLIDEVHMLSNHSFNALLKTLEEPPPHVKFLLATTDAQRLPVTVLSRCLQFHLKNLSAQHIFQQLEHILTQEHIPSETKALHLIAQTAKGSMRDALSLLDQAIAYGNGTILYQEIQQLLGMTAPELLFELLTALMDYNGPQLLHLIAELDAAGADFTSALEDLLSLFHHIAVQQVIPNATSVHELSDATKITALAARLSAEELQLYYQIGLLGRRDLPLAPTPRTGFEMVLLRMLAFSPASSAPPMLCNYSNQTPKGSLALAEAARQTTTTTNLQPLLPLPPVVEMATNTLPKVTTGPAEITKNYDWVELLGQLKLQGVAKLLAANCIKTQQTADTIHLLLDPSHALLLNPMAQQRITTALIDYFQRPLQLHITIGTPHQETPATLDKRLQQQQHSAAVDLITHDSQVQSLMRQFNAHIIPNSIETKE